MKIQLICEELVAFPQGMKLVKNVMFNPTEESVAAIQQAEHSGGYHSISVKDNGGDHASTREHRIMSSNRIRNVVIFHSSER